MTDDARDHAHLYRLLDILPGPSDTNFWQAVADASSTSVSYVFEKMSRAVDFIDQADFVSELHLTSNFADFCLYLVNFFGGTKPEIWEEAHGQLAHSKHFPVGAYLAEDIARTAWRLYVRHRPSNDYDGLIKIRQKHFHG